MKVLEPNSINAIIRISILIMFAIKIKTEPKRNTFIDFFKFKSVVNVNNANNKYADAAVHAEMKFNLWFPIMNEASDTNVGL